MIMITRFASIEFEDSLSGVSVLAQRFDDLIIWGAISRSRKAGAGSEI